jgi:hypothetical protein
MVPTANLSREFPRMIQEIVGNPLLQEAIYSDGPFSSCMRDKETSRGKSRKVESIEGKPAAGADGKVSPGKAAPMTSKEKIAANQKNKRRK